MASFDFDLDVIQKSHELPVLVDFWAPWCGPCRVMGPVLEQLAEENTEHWTLVKVNTEEEPELGQQFNIRSIPNVKLFHKGKEIAEFLGALPKRSIEDWLSEQLPDERKDQMHELLENLGNDPFWEAPDDNIVSNLSDFVENNPDLIDARLALARGLLATNPALVPELLSVIKPGTKWFDAADDLVQLSRLLTAENSNDSPAAKPILKARQSLQLGREGETIESLIQATMLDKTYLNDLPRKATIALFRTLGEQHELTRKYRRMFDMALY